MITQKDAIQRHHLLSKPVLHLVSLCFLLAGSSVWADSGEIGWPEFRGPWANGIAGSQDGKAPVGIPLRWSESENVLWKTAIPHKGWSTPVVLEGRIWLTTATEEGHDYYVLCIDAETGKILIDRKLFHSGDPEPLGNIVNSYASPTAAIEAGRVYIHFGSYGTACLDTGTGETIWERTDLECRHYRGPGSSVVLFENLLFLTFDGADVQYLAALDKETGATVWKTDRSTIWPDLDEDGQPLREGDFRKAFTTPLIVWSEGQPLLISPGSYCVFAYNARTGKEIWRIHNGAYSPAPRPIASDDLLYVVTGRGAAALWALRPGMQGDVDPTQLVWSFEGRRVPNEPSPLLVDGLLYLLSNDGILTCLDAATGAEIWDQRIGGNYMASSIYADGRIYCFSVQGKVTVLKAGRETKVLAENNLDEGFMASPAVVGKTLYLRTKTHLYRIEE
jgi:outer membrane protein assembly factor BamB